MNEEQRQFKADTGFDAPGINDSGFPNSDSKIVLANLFRLWRENQVLKKENSRLKVRNFRNHI